MEFARLPTLLFCTMKLFIRVETAVVFIILIPLLTGEGPLDMVLSTAMSRTGSVLFVLGGVAAILYLIMKRKQQERESEMLAEENKKKESKEKEGGIVNLPNDDLWNTVMFFPDYFPERKDSETQQLLWYLNQAKESIDVCMFSFNFRMIEDVLRNKAEEGVNIRVVTDAGMARSALLISSGIRLRRFKHRRYNPLSPNLALDLMHHKFVVIDNKAVMSGSLNWTKSGITENWENVMITNHSNITYKYRQEFRKIWIASVSVSTRISVRNSPYGCVSARPIRRQAMKRIGSSIAINMPGDDSE